VLTPHYDIANVRLEFPSGAVANLNASRVSAKTFRKFRVFSPKAYASLDFVTNGVHVYHRNEKLEIERSTLEPSPLDALQAQCQQFVDCVRERKAPLVSGRDGLLALKYAEIVRAKIEERNRQAFEAGGFALHPEPSWV
jgi:predicted dehydrogenase